MKNLLLVIPILMLHSICFADGPKGKERPDDTIKIVWEMHSVNGTGEFKEFIFNLELFSFEITQKKERRVIVQGKFQSEAGYIWIDQTIGGKKIELPRGYISAPFPETIRFDENLYALKDSRTILRNGIILNEGDIIDPFTGEILRTKPKITEPNQSR